ncbi:zinc finger BED domain-containing protein RICESLEEPER 1-like [Phoenix dactylifera]|uniref:Zinc finger BED domain-containing protein RICESLEEPER 1-like n=1 Tax=Phoenix dactylifera TaxID=42345 RepID=A0A8B9ANI9_PHODC|nr:zinc finger BED domain-containing protein RICESLEEPER 1-like [Phoenix dactylifera]
MPHSKMGENEIVEDLKDEDDGNEDTVENDCDKNSRKRSWVWNHFIEEKNSEGSIAKCKYCKKVLSGSTKGGTSHLKRHLEKVCKKYQKNPTNQLLLLPSSKDPIKAFKFNQEESRKILAKFIICAELPFRIVEHTVFLDFMRSLQPLFKIMGRKIVKHDCMALYQEERKKLQDVFKNLSSRVSFTTDIWTSNQKIGYISFTAHYIDSDFVLHKKIISFKKLPYPHTSFAIEDAVRKCLVEWELDCKICAITLDNCSTNDAVMRKLRDHFCYSMLFSEEYSHIRCCAHILNIMVQDEMKIIHEAIECIREIARYVSASPSRMQAFNEIVQHMRLPARKGLTLDVPTRWNSTYEMLHDALGYKDALIRYATEHSCVCPTNDERKKASIILKFLEAFLDSTKVFSGCKYPTSNLYLKEVWGIRALLMDESIDTDETVKQLTNEMLKKFNKYWSQCNNLLVIVSILDSRSKLIFVEFCYQKAFELEECKKKIDDIRACLFKLYNEYVDATRMQPSMSSSERTSNFGGQGDISSVSSKKKIGMNFAQFRSQSSSKRSKRSELDSYLDDDVLPDLENKEFDILAWWKSNATVYPILSRIARDVLAIPVSTVSSESAFSTGGRVVDQYRSSLSPSTVKALVCTQDWLREQYDEVANCSSSVTLNVDDDTLDSWSGQFGRTE